MGDATMPIVLGVVGALASVVTLGAELRVRN